DVGDRAAVGEIAVHRQRQDRAGSEAAVEILALAPTGDQPWGQTLGVVRVVVGRPFREADESGDGGRGGRQHFLRRRYFFDVHPGGRISRHAHSFFFVRSDGGWQT